LDDPVFEKLPAPAKIQFLKDHARELHDGINPGYSRQDYKSLAWDIFKGAGGGALLGSSLGTSLPGSLGLRKLEGAAVGGVLGGFAGGIAGAMRGTGPVDARRTIRNQLAQTIKNPSDANTVGVLSVRGIHQRDSAVKNKILEYLASNSEELTTTKVIPEILSDLDTQLKQKSSLISTVK
jgi:hypothetical protein